MAVQAEKNSLQSIAILGARGYSGAELARLLLKHPSALVSGLYATQAFSSQELLPELSNARAAALPGRGMGEFQADVESAKPSF